MPVRTECQDFGCTAGHTTPSAAPPRGTQRETPTCRVLHFQLRHDRPSVARHKESLQMVDHHLVHPVGPHRSAHHHGELLARLDLPTPNPQCSQTGRTDGMTKIYQNVWRTFFSTASSSPLICFAPSFSIELIPPAVAKAILSCELLLTSSRCSYVCAAGGFGGARAAVSGSATRCPECCRRCVAWVCAHGRYLPRERAVIELLRLRWS